MNNEKAHFFWRCAWYWRAAVREQRRKLKWQKVLGYKTKAPCRTQRMQMQKTLCQKRARRKIRKRLLRSRENEATSEATVENTTEPKYLTLDISTMGEILADGDAVDPIGLTILSEEENGVSWANDWYDSENLSLPMIGTDWNSFYDDHYQYQWVDDELYIYETGTGNCIYVLDYPTDQWYINGNNAYLEDGTFLRSQREKRIRAIQYLFYVCL